MIITTTKEMRPRDIHDFYPSPLPLCQAALQLVVDRVTPVDILDPGAGTGVWGQAVRSIWRGPWIDGVELNGDHLWPAHYNDWQQADYLDWIATRRYDLVCGNPPYKHAEAFVRRSLSLTKPGGYVVFLLRLAFLEGQARGAGLWQEHPPVQVAVCSKRPSFTPDNRTDSTAYSIFVWQKGWHGNTSLTWLSEGV